MVTGPAIRLLVIEADPATARLMAVALEDRFGPGSVRCCRTIAQAVREDLSAIHLAIANANLPDGCVSQLLARLLDERLDLPVIVVGGPREADRALAAIRAGAADYVVRAGDYLFALPLVAEKTLSLWKTKQENIRLHAELSCTLTALQVKNRQLEDAVRKLQTVAATDPLTGLANRRAFNMVLERSFAEASRYGHDLACIMIDLDCFKLCNDLLGHQKGDEILQRAARVLEANCRRSDTPARYGGDEFVVLLPQTELEWARRGAERIADEMRFCCDGWLKVNCAPTSLSMSMGLTTLRHGHPASADELVGQADKALYAAKSAGKSQLVVYRDDKAAVGA